MARTVIVAGVGETLGTAVAETLAARGDRSVLVARSRDVIEPLAAELRDDGADAVAVRADLTDPDDVTRAVDAGRDAFGRIDGAVHTANVPGGGRFADCTVDDFDHVWRARARAAFLLARETAEDLVAADGTAGDAAATGETPGRLVVAGTNYATEPSGSATAWDSAAAATRGLARSLATDPAAPDATYAAVETALAPPGTDPGPVRTAAETVAADLVNLLSGDAPPEVTLPRRTAEV